MLRRDPENQGHELFKQNCASCHSHGDAIRNDRATAADLAGFGTREWIVGLLTNPHDPRYLARTKLKAMTGWLEREHAAAKKKGKEKDLQDQFALIATWLAGHPRKDVPDSKDQSDFARGYRAFEDKCSSCHAYKDTGGGEANAPDFTGYGDADWIRMMVMLPSDKLRYGDHNTMPAFRDLEGPDGEVKRAQLKRMKEMLLEAAAGDKKKEQAAEDASRVMNLNDVDRELIIRWLVGDNRVVFGGDPIAVPPR